MNDTNVSCISHRCVYTPGKQNLSGTYSFLQPNIPPFSGFRARAFCGGKRTCLWSLGTKHFLIDTNIFCISNAMCTNTWKTKLERLSSLHPNVPPFRGFRARFWVFWGGKLTFLWSISTKALSKWSKHLLYILNLQKVNCLNPWDYTTSWPPGTTYNSLVICFGWGQSQLKISVYCISHLLSAHPPHWLAEKYILS